MPGFEEMMDKHFDLAGVPADEQSSAPDANTNQNVGETNEQSTTQGSEQTASPQQEAQKQEGEQPATDKQAGGSDKPNSDKQSGQKKEGQGATNPGDLTLRDGTVVKAGQERRWYESWQTSRQQLQMTQRDLNTANQKMQTLETRLQAITEATQQIGLEDPTHVQSAVRLYKDLASNPVETLTKLIAEVKGMGHNIDGIGSAVDNRILNQINQKLNNTSENTHVVPAVDDQAIEAEVANFLRDFPDAITHEALIGELVEKHPQLSLSEAYFSLKQSAIARGLDWSKPLLPQINAQVSGQQQQQQAPQQRPAPMVNGRVGSMDNVVDRDIMKEANWSEDTDSIVLAAMRDGGIQYQR